MFRIFVTSFLCNMIWFAGTWFTDYIRSMGGSEVIGYYMYILVAIAAYVLVGAVILMIATRAICFVIRKFRKAFAPFERPYIDDDDKI